MPLNIVAKFSVDSYELDDLVRALRKGLDLIGSFKIEDGMNVVIKPNLSDLCPPETGVTTHPIFIEALVKVLWEIANVKIYLVESDHWAATADEEFEYLGYTELARKYDITLVNLSKDKKIEVQINGKHLKRLKVPYTLLFADKFVSVAKMKTHFTEVISCILKNQFGLLPQRYKSEFHPYLSETLTDLNNLYHPDLCIIDGIVGLEGPGPTAGTPHKFGVTLLGTDPVSIDAVAATIMGFNPKRIPHLKFAKKCRIGTFHFSESGEPIKLSKAQFIPTLAYKSLRTALFFEKHHFSNASKIFYFVGHSKLKGRPINQQLKLILKGIKRLIGI